MHFIPLMFTLHQSVNKEYEDKSNSVSPLSSNDAVNAVSDNEYILKTVTLGILSAHTTCLHNILTCCQPVFCLPDTYETHRLLKDIHSAKYLPIIL